MMDVPGCCGRRPCNDCGLGDICQGVNCIIGGVSKSICCGLNMLGSLGCALAQPCCPPPRPCCRPRPHPPACTCRCVCRCERVCDNRRCC